jgi:hypothetical protein
LAVLVPQCYLLDEPFREAMGGVEGSGASTPHSGGAGDRSAQQQQVRQGVAKRIAKLPAFNLLAPTSRA